MELVLSNGKTSCRKILWEHKQKYVIRQRRTGRTHGCVRSDVFKEVLSGLKSRVWLLLFMGDFWKETIERKLSFYIS